MTGVLPFLLFSLSSQSFTHMDAQSSQSFTSTSQGHPQTRYRMDEFGLYELIEYDGIMVKQYLPEPEGDPSY